MHSSIRSSSTSQYLNDDNSNLSIPSAQANSLLPIGSVQDAPERLLDFFGVRRNFGVRQPLRLRRAAPFSVRAVSFTMWE
jgi:hypothetical protein